MNHNNSIKPVNVLISAAGFGDSDVPLSAQGLVSYLSRFMADVSSRGVVVGFDTRAQEESGCSSQRSAPGKEP